MSPQSLITLLLKSLCKGMKINRITENCSHKHTKFGVFIVNAYYFLAFARYIGITLFAVAFFAFVKDLALRPMR